MNMQHEEGSKSTLDAEKQYASGTTTPAVLEKNDAEPHVDAIVESPPAEQYPTGKALIPIVLDLNCAVLIIALDQTIVGTAIPKITDDFGGLSQVSWYGSVYFMTFGGLTPASGKLFRYFPLKMSFIGAIVIFGVGSLICAVAQNSTTFVVGRAIAGVGGAAVATGAFVILAFAAEPRIRPGLVGMMGGVYGLSSLLGPIVGGAFAEKVSWRWW